MKKRALLICKETMSWPFYYIKDYLQNDFNIAFYFFSPHEAVFKESDFFQMKKLCKNFRFYDNKKILDIFPKNLKNLNIDYTYLKYINSKYCSNIPFSLQAIAGQELIPYYHDRDYYLDNSLEIIHKYFELFYKASETVFKNFKPDVIFDVDNSEYSRTFLFEIARYYKIPYILPDHTRILNLRIPSFNLKRETDKWFRNKFVNELKQKNYKNSQKFVRDYFKKDDILSTGHKIILSKNNLSFMKVSYSFMINYFFAFLRSFQHIKNRGGIKNPIFYKSSKRINIYLIRYLRTIRRNFLPNFYHDVDINAPYILFPLHKTPEATTFVKTPFYVNQILVIEAISKSLKFNQYLYVKEHYASLTERKSIFYKKLSRLPNVKFVDPFKYTVKELIKCSEGVITITGSTALEAQLLGKNSAVFGESQYNLVSSIDVIKSFKDIPKIIKKWPKKINKKELYAYINICNKYGFDIDMNHINIPPKFIKDKDLNNKNALNLYKLFINDYKKNFKDSA